MSFCQNEEPNHNTQSEKEKQSDFSKSDFTIFGKKLEYWRTLCHRSGKKIEHSQGNHSKSNMIFIHRKGSCRSPLSFSSCQNTGAKKIKKTEHTIRKCNDFWLSFKLNQKFL